MTEPAVRISAAGRADGQLEQVGERDGQVGALAQAADGGDGQAQVEHGGHGERDPDDRDSRPARSRPVSGATAS